MADQISGTFETKQIHELQPLVKLNGKEEVIIDDGNGTLRVTVDTLLGYIRDQINASVGGDTGGGDTATSSGGTIHVIQKGEENIPAESRLKDHFYLRVVDAHDAQLSTGLPRIVKVSPNMGLRMIVD